VPPSAQVATRAGQHAIPNAIKLMPAIRLITTPAPAITFEKQAPKSTSDEQRENLGD
jgi:hypothetical protein